MTKLGEKLRRELARGALVTFHEFMETALYDPEFGYYTVFGHTVGRGGDFYTSASVSRHFGALLAEQAARTWEALDRPEAFTILEAGAGVGHVALDMLTALEDTRPDVFACVRYLIDERSPSPRTVQETRLSGFIEKIGWLGLDSLAPDSIEGLVFGNELIDAMPVHRVRMIDGRLCEAFVELRDDEFQTVWKPPSRPDEFEAYLRKSELTLTNGGECEIGLAGVAWLKRAAGVLKRGFVLTIDYGDLGDHLSAEFGGTARCFYRHTVNTDFFERIGEQDITADVNFSTLIAFGRDFGLRPARFDRQADFLIGLGLLDRLEAASRGDGGLPALKERLALKHFLVPGGFGDRFKVLLQEK